ncbi:threonine aldolase family protein [Diaminobutyricibacter sp. McL0608]|uniref:threonine aldolase family protein n=1 Tax=Leifsonia sp. McL0608 TaxID=3143537 RepID=UPI0031F2F176
MTDADRDPATVQSPRQRLWVASRSATKLLSNERPFTYAERLAALASSPNAAAIEAVDTYGGGIVERLERRVAALLGKPAALWLPTGTMAQQAVLRVWASRAGTARIAVHPLHHTQVNEEDAFATLSGLEPVQLTREPRQPTAADLAALSGPLAAAVVELPMQELGYVLPTWEGYGRFAQTARERGIPLHVDGARIWESQHQLGRSAAQIAALASSVYVSMYKGIGGLSGALVAGDAEVIAEARVWRTRYGGDVFRQFPAVVAALDGLDTRLERMSDWARHAGAIAQGLSALPGLAVTPDPPHICEFWVYADLPADALNDAVLEHLEASGERWVHDWWTGSDGRAVAEITVRDEALAWTADNVARVGRRVLARAAQLTAS